MWCAGFGMTFEKTKIIAIFRPQGSHHAIQLLPDMKRQIDLNAVGLKDHACTVRFQEATTTSR